MKEIKDPSKWRNILWSWIERLGIVEMLLLPIYTISIKSQQDHFWRLEQTYKIYMQSLKNYNSQNNLFKKKVGKFTLSDLRLTRKLY